ncbi:restriction endonuclease subunit S [Flavobacterium sp.]|uniref:restriction endonuclease subunit S n=1 Tax=Flavobacterium sp. TaxID=239 RepID=UPI0035AE9A71
MSSYTISPTLNKSRVFILQKSELEKRFDPFFYVPELLELEKKVLAKKPKKLRDFVKGLASGATPKRDEEDKYYSDKENGIPFLRVQNVTEFGLDLTDVKFINKETHEGYLKRSQISEGDLIVTITGRIASAAVAPDGFIGNTNQHSVVIKTGSKEISEKLAAYLNCSIGQKLANRLATGGTRPALDYPALLSIPIIEDNRILQITDKVIAQKQKNEAEAENILSSIDDYLMKELGITLPIKPENSLKNRMFISTYKQLSGNRYDPFYYKNYFVELEESLNNGKYGLKRLSTVCNLQNGYAFKSSDYIEFSETLNIRMSNIRPNNVFDPDYNPRYLPNEYAETYKEFLLKDGDIIIAMTDMAGDPKILGVPTIVTNSNNRKLLLNQRVGKLFDFKTTEINIEYLKEILGARIVKEYYNKMGARGVQINISSEQILSAKIPVPPLDKQKEIAEHITGIRQQAQQLKDKTNELLKKASEEIEEILLN